MERSQDIVANEVKNLLGDLEPEEAAQIALTYLRSIGRVVKVWERDDILSQAEQDPEFDALTEEEKTRVIDLAEQDSCFQNLEDATEQDWEAISQAVDAGMFAVYADRA